VIRKEKEAKLRQTGKYLEFEKDMENGIKNRKNEAYDRSAIRKAMRDAFKKRTKAKEVQIIIKKNHDSKWVRYKEPAFKK
jgi:hypothetical protein